MILDKVTTLIELNVTAFILLFFLIISISNGIFTQIMYLVSLSYALHSSVYLAFQSLFVFIALLSR